MFIQNSVKVKKIKKISLDSPVPVYDIEAPVYENFTLANGLVVHNSKDIADAVIGLIQDIWIEGDKVLYVPSVNTKYYMEQQQRILERLKNKRRHAKGNVEFTRGKEW